MSLFNKFRPFMLAAILLMCSIQVKAQNVEILFSGITSPHGQIIVKVFTDQKSFENDKAIKAVKFKKNGLANGQLPGKLTLEPGVYGFALLDDENDNGKMDYNMIKMPKEGFGFSNFYLSGLSKPKFEQFKFTVVKDQHTKLAMKLRYL